MNEIVADIEKLTFMGFTFDWHQLIVRPFKIIEDHKIINLVVAPTFTFVFIKWLTFVLSSSK